MERSADGLKEMLERLGIRPPRLEDAGLEDCALPPESIMEAFSRAATSIKSRVLSPLEGEGEEEGSDGGCIEDPGPSNGDIPDALLGTTSGTLTGPICGGGRVTAEKEEVEGQGAQDKVVVVGAGDEEAASDRVLVLGGAEEKEKRESDMGSKKACPVDGDGGLQGLLGEKKGHGDDSGNYGNGQQDNDKPILIETLI